MPDDDFEEDFYNRDPRKEPRAARRPAPPPAEGEGVRVIGAEDAEDAVETGRAARRRRRGEKGFGDVPSRPNPAVPPAARFPLPDEDPGLPDADPGPTWSASTEGLVEEGSGSTRLPHWTEPPTGEVPRILPEAEEGPPGEEPDAWRSISGGTPRYRAGAGDWAEGDDALADLGDDTAALGALDEGPPLDDDADFAESVAARRRGRGRGRRGRAAAPPPPEPPDLAPPPRGPGHLEEEEAPETSAAGEQADVATRVITGVGIAVVALVLLALGRGWTTLLVMAIVGAAVFELYVAIQRAGYQPATIIGLLGSVGAVWIGYKEGLNAFTIVIALVVVFTMLWYMVEVVKARPIVNIAMTLFPFAYVGLLGAFAGVLLSVQHGTGIIIGLAICAVGYDVFGFFVGSQFGRSRMAPRLSPNKTWEGLFGGMAASVILGGLVGSFLAPWDGKLSHGLALGVIVAVMAPLGDLCESMIKRDLGVKDLGTLLPGHGGVLDRFDAMLFCLPAVYFLVIHLGIGG